MKRATTRLSSKGQVVIPAWIREKLHLVPGEELHVEIGDPDKRTIVLRGPTWDEMKRLLEKGYRWLEASGLDMVEALHEGRRKARIRERQRRSR